MVFGVLQECNYSQDTTNYLVLCTRAYLIRGTKVCPTWHNSIEWHSTKTPTDHMSLLGETINSGYVRIKDTGYV